MPDFSVIPTPIAGAYLLERTRRADSRGSLERIFDADELGVLIGGRAVAQVNRTVTDRAGTVRGLHCQLPPSADAKVVTCLAGSAFDVLVDLRGASETFGQWWGVRLDATGLSSVVVPEGCGHGLQTLTPRTEMLYLHSSRFDPSCEAGLHPLDSSLAIEWPMDVTDMSARDSGETRDIEWFRDVAW